MCGYLHFSVVKAAGHMLKSNSADVITSTPKPLVRSLLNHKIEANKTPVAVSTYFTVKIFVTDIGAFVIWYAVNSLINHWVYLCILFKFRCIKNCFKILGVKPIVGGSYCR